MLNFDWRILLLALISEILGTASGLGSSILFLPIAQYFVPPHLVMVLTAVLHVFANGFRVYMFWAPQGFAILKRLAPVFFLTTGLGALLAVWTTPPFYKIALGAVLIIFGVLRLFFVNTRKSLGSKKQILLIGTAGVFTGWVGTGGALRAMVLSTFNLSKYEFIFLSSGIDFGGDALRTFIYIYNGFWGFEHLIYVPALAICAWAGSFVGKLLVSKIPQIFFEKLVLALILIIGIFVILQFFMEQ